MKPSDDPKADKLLNSNINHPEEEQNKKDEDFNETNLEEGIQNGTV